MTRILNERRKGPVTWQSRVSADRGRLEVVGLVPPSPVITVILPLTEAELRELLDDGDVGLLQAPGAL